MTGGVKQCGGQFDFEAFRALHQIDQRRIGDRPAGEKFGSGLGQLGAGLHLVFIGLGIFDERGGGADLRGQKLGGFGGQIRIGFSQLLNQRGAGLAVHVPRGA